MLMASIWKATSEARCSGPLDRQVSPTASEEVTRFLRLMLEDEASVQKDTRVSSHSLKATALSWSSKACRSAPDRAILGRHSRPGDRCSVKVVGSAQKDL